jgi:hypothetical protein
MVYTTKNFGWHLAALGLGIAAVGAALVIKSKKKEHHRWLH